MLFALTDTLADPAKLGAVVLGICAAIMLFERLRSGRRAAADELKMQMDHVAKPSRVELHPSPLEVKPHVSFATTHEVNAIKEDVDQLRTEVRDGFEKLGNARSVSVANLHTKVDAANRKVDELRGEMKIMNQQLHQVLTTMLTK